jgi:peptide/nickel transport system permease protein
MKRLYHIVQAVWQQAPAFRLALLYLVLLALLVLALPWLPLPFQPNELDLGRIYSKPFDWDYYQAGQPFHWLGTDGLGRDLLANILYGARTAFMISVPVMLLATLLGLLLGVLAGLFGNRMATISRSSAGMLFLAVLVVLFYGIYIPIQLFIHEAAISDYVLTIVMTLVLCVVLLLGIAPLLKQVPFFKIRTRLPLDELILRLIEVQTSIPRLILILVLAALVPPTLPALSLLLVITFWTGTARLARAEMLRVRELPFWEAALSLGIPKTQLLLRHALPHLLAPVLVAFSFGLAGLLILESTLSFLNIGVSTDFVSWGRMIAGIRSNTSAWLLVAIPGIFLSLTVLALQTCSYYLLRSLQHRV